MKWNPNICQTSGAFSEVWIDEAAFLEDAVGRILTRTENYSQQSLTLKKSFTVDGFWVRSVYNSSQLKTETTWIFPKASFSNLFRLPSHLLFCGILCVSYSSLMCIYHNSSSLSQTSVFLSYSYSYCLFFTMFIPLPIKKMLSFLTEKHLTQSKSYSCLL